MSYLEFAVLALQVELACDCTKSILKVSSLKVIYSSRLSSKSFCLLGTESFYLVHTPPGRKSAAMASEPDVSDCRGIRREPELPAARLNFIALGLVQPSLCPSDLATRQGFEYIVDGFPLLPSTLLIRLGIIGHMFPVIAGNPWHPGVYLAICLATADKPRCVRPARYDADGASTAVTSGASPDKTRDDAVPDGPLSCPAGPDAGDLSAGCSEASDDGALVKLHNQDVGLVRPEEQLLLGERQTNGGDEHGDVRQLPVADAGAEARKCVGARRRVPDANAPVVAGAYDERAVISPGETVHGPRVRLGGQAGPAVPRVVGVGIATARQDPQAVLLVEEPEEGAGAPDVPDADRAVERAAGEDVLVAWRPGERQHCAATGNLTGRDEGLDRRVCTQINETDGWVSHSACHEKVVRDGGDGVGVDF